MEMCGISPEFWLLQRNQHACFQVKLQCMITHVIYYMEDYTNVKKKAQVSNHRQFHCVSEEKNMF